MQRQAHPVLGSETDRKQREREWRIQRVAWCVLSIVLLAVALGATGRSGPLSVRTEQYRDGSLQLKYNRFMRNHSPDNLRARIFASSETVSLQIDKGYLREVELDKVTPEPAQVIAGSDATVFVFNARPNSEVEATFHLQPEAPGGLAGWIALEGKPRVHFSQFVYP